MKLGREVKRGKMTLYQYSSWFALSFFYVVDGIAIMRRTYSAISCMFCVSE